MTDRGSSATLSYVLSLGIIVLILSGLFYAAGDFVEDQNERVLRSELRVIGHQIAADISNVDQLAIVGDQPSNIELSTDLPDHTAGKSYTINISSTGGDHYEITLATNQPDVSQTISLQTESPVTESRISGGDILITYNGSHIEVDHA